MIKRENLHQEYATWEIFHSDWWKDQQLYKQVKGKRIKHHQSIFTRNVKGTSLSEKEKDRKINMKAMKEKNLIHEGKYTIKIVDQPNINLVEMLKELCI